MARLTRSTRRIVDSDSGEDDIPLAKPTCKSPEPKQEPRGRDSLSPLSDPPSPIKDLMLSNSTTPLIPDQQIVAIDNDTSPLTTAVTAPTSNESVAELIERDSKIRYAAVLRTFEFRNAFAPAEKSSEGDSGDKLTPPSSTQDIAEGATQKPGADVTVTPAENFTNLKPMNVTASNGENIEGAEHVMVSTEDTGKANGEVQEASTMEVEPQQKTFAEEIQEAVAKSEEVRIDSVNAIQVH